MINPEKLKSDLLNEVWHRCGDEYFDGLTIRSLAEAHALLMAGKPEQAAIKAGNTDLSLKVWEAALDGLEKEQKA